MRLPLLLLLAVICLAAAPTVSIYVDDDAGPLGDGGRQSPFRTVDEAISLANSLGGVPTIRISRGTYEVSSTLALTTPAILRGSTELRFDSLAPTGAVKRGSETRLVGTAGLGNTPLLTVGAPGQVLDGVQVSGLIFETPAAIGGLLELRRVQSIVIHDNLFVGTSALAASTPGLATFASSGVIHDVYMAGLLGGAFLAGGYPASAADITFHSNRSVRNQNGLYLNGTSDGIPEPGNELHATIYANDLSDNTVNPPSSAGIRIVIKGNELLPGGSAGLSDGYVTALVRDNRMTGNTQAVAIDAGFPYRRIPGTSSCDTRTFSGRLELTLRGNTLRGNLLQPLITMTRLQAVDNLILRPRFQYLHGAVYVIDDPDDAFASAMVDNPLTDPYIGGPCGDDVVSEPLNNTIVVNGVPQ